MKKIMVAIDFSKASRNASDYAAGLANQFGATLHLLHAHQDPARTIGPESLWLGTSSLLQEGYEELLDAECSYLKERFSIEVTCKELIGHPAQAILEDMILEPPELVVMGWSGYGKNHLLGSTALSVLRKTERPLLLVPENCLFSVPGLIVLAADYQNEPEPSAQMLAQWAARFQCRIDVLHIQKKKQPLSAWEHSGKEEVNALLSGVSHSFHEMEDGSVEEGINRYLNDSGAGLLVMVARKHSLADRIFSGSYTRSMTFRTKIPLLILPEKTPVENGRLVD